MTVDLAALVADEPAQPVVGRLQLVEHGAHVARADLRLVTIVGQLFAASLLAVAAATDVCRGRYLHGILLAAVASLVLLDPGLDRFLVIGHTPAYWPLLGLFALLTSARRHLAAAVLLALLLAARTTMVALVPTFFVYLWLMGGIVPDPEKGFLFNIPKYLGGT